MLKRILALAVALALLYCCAALGEEYHIDDANGMNFANLLIALRDAYETPKDSDVQAIDGIIDVISRVSADDGVIARAIADHWLRVYVNADGSYRLYMYDGTQRATILENTAIEDSPTHAFVVLGYKLENGRISEELRCRCNAAAAAAMTFPSTYIVCSGGATGDNNPKNHTEAGVMKEYLVERCGIDPNRVVIDEAAMNTLENTVNTFEMLMALNIKTITIVTSSYHQRWGQALYNCMAEIYRMKRGYSVEIVENFSYDTEPDPFYARPHSFALRQLAGMLNLPEDLRERLKTAL